MGRGVEEGWSFILSLGDGSLSCCWIPLEQGLRRITPTHLITFVLSSPCCLGSFCFSSLSERTDNKSQIRCEQPWFIKMNSIYIKKMSAVPGKVKIVNDVHTMWSTGSWKSCVYCQQSGESLDSYFDCWYRPADKHFTVQGAQSLYSLMKSFFNSSDCCFTMSLDLVCMMMHFIAVCSARMCGIISLISETVFGKLFVLDVCAL